VDDFGIGVMHTYFHWFGTVDVCGDVEQNWHVAKPTPGLVNGIVLHPVYDSECHLPKHLVKCECAGMWVW